MSTEAKLAWIMPDVLEYLKGMWASRLMKKAESTKILMTIGLEEKQLYASLNFL